MRRPRKDGNSGSKIIARDWRYANYPGAPGERREKRATEGVAVQAGERKRVCGVASRCRAEDVGIPNCSSSDFRPSEMRHLC
jgi:hypothetical protein